MNGMTEKMNGISNEVKALSIEIRGLSSEVTGHSYRAFKAVAEKKFTSIDIELAKLAVPDFQNISFGMMKEKFLTFDEMRQQILAEVESSSQRATRSGANS